MFGDVGYREVYIWRGGQKPTTPNILCCAFIVIPQVSTLTYSQFNKNLHYTYIISQPISVLTISNLTSKKDDISSAVLPLL